MKLKTIELEWYAFYWSWNNHDLKRTNVLGGDLKEKIYKKIKSNTITNKSNLRDYIRSYLMYYYWCKAEYEVLVGDLHTTPDTSDFKKIDIYYQLEPNLDNIVDYIINKMEIVFKDGK